MTRELSVGLSAIVEPGNRELGQIVRRVGAAGAADVLCAAGVSEQLVGAATVRLGRPLRVAEIAALGERLMGDAERLGVRIVCPGDEEWPARVADLVRISR